MITSGVIPQEPSTFILLEIFLKYLLLIVRFLKFSYMCICIWVSEETRRGFRTFATGVAGTCELPGAGAGAGIRAGAGHLTSINFLF